MPLSEREKISRAIRMVRKYHPETSAKIVRNVARNICARFNGDCSPIQDEHETPMFRGRGNGLTFNQYALMIICEQLGKPAQVSKDVFVKYQHKALM